MRQQTPERDTTPTIRDLYPELNDEQLVEAEENLTRYVEDALLQYERIRSDPEAYAQFKELTRRRRTT